MPRQGLRNAVLMLVGSLVAVQTLVAVLERQARPTHVDPAFFSEVQQAQYLAHARIYTGAGPVRSASYTGPAQPR
jgi:hypothetical protein